MERCQRNKYDYSGALISYLITGKTSRNLQQIHFILTLHREIDSESRLKTKYVYVYEFLKLFIEVIVYIVQLRIKD